MNTLTLLLALAGALTSLQPTNSSQPPTSPSEVLAAATPEDWRAVEADDLLVITLANGKQVFVELAPTFAPVHVDNVRRLARAHWYDGSTVHRVQENYVVQWGQVEGEPVPPLPEGVIEQPPTEYEVSLNDSQLARFTLVQEGHYTARSGYLDTWPIGLETSGSRVSGGLIHCYGTVGVGRGNPPDTGSGIELYAVIGHAPRHLDRNLAVVGRVIEGLQTMSSLPRGTGDLGMYETAEERLPITSVRLASTLAEQERPNFRVLRTDTTAFRRYVEARANRGAPFFVRPAGSVDVCNVLLPMGRAPK